MAKDSSFDVVSQVDMQEMNNAVNQTKKEIAQRYDFRGSYASIELEEKCIKLAAQRDITFSQTLTILQGIPKEKAKAIVAAIKATKLKVNAQMQDDQVRVSGAKKDDLQAVIQTLKAGDFGVDLQFNNMR